jgi:hypothetical protein
LKQPDISNVSSLFESNSRYKAPVFQRLYVWGRPQLESLFEDLETADPTSGQFLGAIVLKDLGKSEGPASPSNYLLIDGQQRLTTFYMLFVALAKVADDNGDEETCTYIMQNFLMQTKSPKFAGRPKLVPTLQDRAALWKVLEESFPEAGWDFSRDLGEERSNPRDSITPQWKRILGKCEESFRDKDGKFVKEEFERVLRSLQEQLQLIVITLEQIDDANAIFSRLNAKGVPLELADLVRNEVFSKFGAEDADKAEKFYYKTWQPFEKTFPGETFDQFFPVYAQIVFKGKVTISTAFTNLQEKWNSSKPHLILADLEKYSPYYTSLHQYEHIKSLDLELNRCVERFSRMPRTTVTWPFLIETLRAVSEERLAAGDAKKVFRIVEAFLVRRSLMGLEPTGLHAVFKTLWDKTKGDPKLVLEKIVTRTIQVPNDVDISQSLYSEPVDTRVILKYLFQEYEKDFTEKRKYDLSPTVGTIEHIAPQNLSDGWKTRFSPQEHAKLVGLIGNLAALSEKQNKSLQDQPWDEKRLRFKGSDFKATQALSSKRVWNPESILTRTTEMAKWIVDRWPPLESI